MSPTSDRSRRPLDAGFSLVEVMVSFVIVGVLVLAVLPQVVAGLKANESASRSTQAKALVQSELERIRNLPYQVNPNAGEFIDVFDRYFRNLDAPTAPLDCTGQDGEFIALVPGNTGYVNAASAARCDWEPDGPMYRVVRTATSDATRPDPDLGDFTVVTNVQFLSSATPPVAIAPVANYNTQVINRDAPASGQIGVTVTAFPNWTSVNNPISSYTQVSRTYSSATRIRAAASATALRVSGYTDRSVPITMAGGVLNLSGSLNSASTVDVLLTGVIASSGTGSQGAGATVTGSAPPSSTLGPAAASNGALDAAEDCDLVCWGGSTVESVPVSATDSLLNAGSPTNPLLAYVRQPSAEGQAFRFSNGSGSYFKESLNLTPPLVRTKDGATGSATTSTCTVSTSGSSVRMAASGWLRTTAPNATTDPMRVDTCATARSSEVTVLPTGFAPNGILRITVTQASARCVVAGTAHVPTATYDYSVRVDKFVGGSTPYQTVATITPTTTNDVLSGLDPTTVGIGPTIGGVPQYGYLSKWVDSWSSITPSRIVKKETAQEATVTIPGIVNVLTVPLRFQTDTAGALIRDALNDPIEEPLSTVNLTAGAVSCTARDRR